MWLHYSIIFFVSLSAVTCYTINPVSALRKQLFLSRNVVTDSEQFDGGVLVNEMGVIEAVLRKEYIDVMLRSESSWNIQVCLKLVPEHIGTPVYPANVGTDYKHTYGGEWALMAGGVDSHVHVNEPGRTSWEGYVTATQSAAIGGFTTIIDMPLNSIPPTISLNNLKIKADIAKEEIFVDVGFWGGVVPGNGKELQKMVKAGVVGFKCFLINSGVSEFPYVTVDDLEDTFKFLNGTKTVLAFHAELHSDSDLTECEGSGCASPALYNTYLASRPDVMEIEAASLIASQIHKTDVHMHVVHVSSAAVVPILEEARDLRTRGGYLGWRGGITAETCHHYLSIDSEQIPPGHTEFKCAPPIRNNTNRQQLWSYIRDGRLDLIASDHSPSPIELKENNFLEAWGGVSSLQFGMSLFWTEAKARGHDLRTVSHYLSAGPARLCGLQDKKGAIRPGLDADLIYFDPNASFVVTPDIIRYKNKISPYMNRVLTGKVMQTYLRGQLIYSAGNLLAVPKGNLLLTL